jgi:leader peptidase (prepilin peptidase)/N-methyltransferase
VEWLFPYVPYVWLLFTFVIGVMVGSFLNVCIVRLPMEKSLLWPGSRCGHCLQPVRWYDNIPLWSYLYLRGRCRTCGTTFSARYFVIELVTGLGFAGLFYLEVMLDIHHWATQPHQRMFLQYGVYPWQWWVAYAYHAVLFSFLLVASACDLDGRQIPLSLTTTGTVIGLVGSIFLPWPWPRPLPEVESALRRVPPNAGWWQLMDFEIPTGLYPWPVWGPLPDWLPPGSPLLGLATGVAGALAGTFLVRAIAWLAKTGLGREALGLGDADLMMMAGAFLGWQPVVLAFFVSAAPALVFALVQAVVYRDNSLPFGPSLAAAVIITWLCWGWIGPPLQIFLFWRDMLLGVALVGGGLMLGLFFAMRLIRPAPS